MSTVLFIKANNRPIEQAVSVKLYHAFKDSYVASHPDDQIIELDLFAEQPRYFDNTTMAGLYKTSNGIEATPEEQAAADIANKYLDQFLAADKVVFGFPLWNMTVPAVLHTYIDYLNRAGKTFKYTPEGPVGLATGKKAAVINARGGIYSEGPRMASEMAVNYVTANLALFGIEDLTTIIVEGHNQLPDQAAGLVEVGIAKAAESARSF